MLFLKPFDVCPFFAFFFYHPLHVLEAIGLNLVFTQVMVERWQKDVFTRDGLTLIVLLELLKLSLLYHLVWVLANVIVDGPGHVLQRRLLVPSLEAVLVDYGLDAT